MSAEIRPLRTVTDLGSHAIVPEHTGEHRIIPAGAIHIDRTYQRDPSSARVSRIANHWTNPAPIRVSQRTDGEGIHNLYVYDGQHRLIAFLARFGPEAGIDCWVERLTRDEEARRFALQYVNVTRVPPAAILKALASTGDEVSTGALSLMQHFGLIPNQTLRGVATWTALYARDSLILELAVSVMRQAWGDWEQPAQPPAALYIGMFDLLFYHGNDIERDRLVEVLSKTPPKTVIFRGLQAHPGVTKLGERDAYEALLDLYNGAKREGRLVRREFPRTVMRRQVGDSL